MSTKKLGQMLRLLFLSLFVSALSGCATIPNTTVCTVAGVFSAGAICAETLTPNTSSMTLDEYLAFLEPQAERPDPANPGKTLPPRAGAMCQSADDWNAQKTALEQTCRLLGPRCSYQVKKAIKSLNSAMRYLNSKAVARKQ